MRAERLSRLLCFLRLELRIGVLRVHERRKTPRTRRELMQQTGGALVPFLVCTGLWFASGASGSFWPAWVALVALIPLVRNGWRLYGPSPELERVERELRRNSRHRRRRGVPSSRPKDQ